MPIWSWEFCNTVDLAAPSAGPTECIEDSGNCDIDGNGIDDVFAWDNDGGINRVALFDTMANTPPRIIDNLVAPLAINGEYDEIVQLRDDVFADADGDEFFFWDPTNGRNRVAFV